MTQTGICCETCGKTISSFDQWFSEDCPSLAGEKSGHALNQQQILALEWRPVAQADQKEAANDHRA